MWAGHEGFSALELSLVPQALLRPVTPTAQGPQDRICHTEHSSFLGELGPPPRLLPPLPSPLTDLPFPPGEEGTPSHQPAAQREGPTHGFWFTFTVTDGTTVPTLQSRKLKPRVGERAEQEHTGGRGWVQDRPNPGWCQSPRIRGRGWPGWLLLLEVKRLVEGGSWCEQRDRTHPKGKLAATEFKQEGVSGQICEQRVGAGDTEAGTSSQGRLPGPRRGSWGGQIHGNLETGHVKGMGEEGLRGGPESYRSKCVHSGGRGQGGELWWWPDVGAWLQEGAQSWAARLVLGRCH